MNRLSRYIAKYLLGAMAIVLLMIGGLEFFVLMVKELNDLGTGQYSILFAFVYVLMQLPAKLYLFFPIIMLLGCLVGLGELANRHELVVMRASGFSIKQITMVVIKVSLGLILLTFLLGETLFPSWLAKAQIMKANWISAGQTLQTKQGIWIRDKKRFIHIGQAKDNQLKGIMGYNFDDNDKLVSVFFAKAAQFKKQNWALFDVTTQILKNKKIITTHANKQMLHVSFTPKLIHLNGLVPAALSLAHLHTFIQQKTKNHIAVPLYRLAFWQRVMGPFASLVMVLLGIPFIFGPLRSAAMGLRLMAGVGVAFLFYLMNQMFGPIAMVYQLPPILGASLPILIFAVFAWGLLARLR